MGDEFSSWIMFWTFSVLKLHHHSLCSSNSIILTLVFQDFYVKKKYSSSENWEGVVSIKVGIKNWVEYNIINIVHA